MGIPLWFPSVGVPALRKAYSSLGKVQSSVDVVQGDLIIVAFSVAGSLVVASCADNASGGTNTYTELGSGAGYTSPIHGHVWYAIAKATETISITVTSANSTSACTYVHVVSQCASSDVVDQYLWDANEGARSTSHTGASLTTTNANDYLFNFWFNDDNGGTYSENGTGYVRQLTRSATAYGATFDQSVSSIGTYAENVTTSVSTYTGNFHAAFKAVASGTGTGLPSGVSGTAEVGTATISAGVNVTVSGVSGTAAFGTVTPKGAATASASGLSSTAAVGSPNAIGAAAGLPSGVSGTGAVGTATVAAGVNRSVTGVAGTGAVGTATVSAGVSVTVSGVYGTAAVGNATASAGTSIPATATPSGVAGTSANGSPSASGASSVTASGVSGSAAVGSATASGGSAVPATALPDGVSGTAEVGQASHKGEEPNTSGGAGAGSMLFFTKGEAILKAEAERSTASTVHETRTEGQAEQPTKAPVKKAKPSNITPFNLPDIAAQIAQREAAAIQAQIALEEEQAITALLLAARQRRYRWRFIGGKAA